MTLSLIVCIVSGIVYFLCAMDNSGAKITGVLAEMSRLAFFAGLLAFLLGK